MFIKLGKTSYMPIFNFKLWNLFRLIIFIRIHFFFYQLDIKTWYVFTFNGIYSIFIHSHIIIPLSLIDKLFYLSSEKLITFFINGEMLRLDFILSVNSNKACMLWEIYL